MWQAKEPTLAAAELGMAGAGMAVLVLTVMGCDRSGHRGGQPPGGMRHRGQGFQIEGAGAAQPVTWS
jgi:hypothetical protein